MTDTLIIPPGSPMVRRATIAGNSSDLYPSHIELHLTATLHTLAGMPPRDLIEAADQQAIRNGQTRPLVKQRMP